MIPFMGLYVDIIKRHIQFHYRFSAEIFLFLIALNSCFFFYYFFNSQFKIDSKDSIGNNLSKINKTHITRLVPD